MDDHRRAVEHFAHAAAVYAATLGEASPPAVRLAEDRAVDVGQAISTGENLRQ